jgi:Cof subfamily protein (haloacid dehalogenase superfamily)
MIKLIATDMDGTFLDGNGSYDRERLAKLLQKLEEEGIVFVVSSGRALLAVDKLFDGFIDQIAVVAENGGVVQYKGQVLYEDLMSPDLYLELAELLKENPYFDGTNFLLSGKDASYILEGTDQAYIDHLKLYYENVKLVKDLTQITDDIFKLTASFNPETVDQGAEWMNQHANGVISVTTGFQSIDIIFETVNKATGLSHLCQNLGLEPSSIMAFGDNLNDYEMLELAGYAVATENARPEIKEISDEVIGHHKTEAVITYLERFVRGEK